MSVMNDDTNGDAPGTVDSRWWYWIAAYPVATLLVLPVIIIIGLIALAPALAIGADPAPAPVIGWAIILVFAAFLLFGLLVGMLVVFVMLPIALFFDARAVQEADVEWNPDPIVYALVTLLQFFVTPLVGLVVSLYYLYRRHEVLGVP